MIFDLRHPRHCEERSDEAIDQLILQLAGGLLHPRV
jgi:hypothetical protein